MNWDDFRYLLALRQAGSLGAAARALKIDPSTMGRRVAALESAIGAQLVVRQPEGVRLTPEGVVAAEAAEHIQQTVDDVLRRIAGSSGVPRGTVRVAVSDGFATLLYPTLSELRERHPEICVELVISSEIADLSRGEADIAIRPFRETKGNLVARRIGDFGWSLYAAESYVEHRGLPADPTKLAGLEVIGFSDIATRSTGARWLEANSDGAQIVFRASSVRAALDAARAGAGIAVLPCFLTAGHPSLRRLTPRVVAQGEAFLLLTQDGKDVERVRVVVEALAAFFARNKPLLAGEL